MHDKWKKITCNSSFFNIFSLQALDMILNQNFIVSLDLSKESVRTGQKGADDLDISWGKIAVILQNCKSSEIVLGLIVAVFITANCIILPGLFRGCV